MLGRIVEIEGEGRRLSLNRGFLEISAPEGYLGQVPLDDIEAVILSNPAASFTAQLVAALAERGAPLVISGPDYRPSAYVLPIDGHHAQGNRMEAQAEASLPTRKRLWAHLVKRKIAAQASALERIGVESGPVAALVDRVRSGDVDNLEAQAAQRYFPLLFGSDFRRYRDGEGANALLNYGYTVLRAATARAIVAAGLNPALSIFHRSRGQALRLADDLMEPFRPAVDLIVAAQALEADKTLDTTSKRRLVSVLHADYETSEGRAPLSNVLARLAISLAQVFAGERKGLAFPKSPIPLGPISESSQSVEL
jgi:CRISPR-associated protein Cas1